VRAVVELPSNIRPVVWVLALGCVHAGCTDRSSSDATASAAGDDDAADEPTETTGDALPAPGVLESVCENICARELECLPEEFPKYHGSLEECATGCSQPFEWEWKFEYGCGPESVARLECYADLTCEQLILQYEIEEGGPCGKGPICGED
jgi:hypothetical protein